MDKRKPLRPTDGINSYIADWKLTLESDAKHFSAIFEHVINLSPRSMGTSIDWCGCTWIPKALVDAFCPPHTLLTDSSLCYQMLQVWSTKRPYRAHGFCI